MPTALVTGADSGIGNAFVKVLLNEGYHVCAVDRNTGDGLKALSSHDNVTTHELDVTSVESIQKFKKALGNETIDLLLNIAGIMKPPAQDKLETVTLETLQQVFAVNTYGPLLLTQAVLPNLLQSSSPKLGIVSSRVGSIGDNSSGGNYAYRSSKAAVNSIGKNLAIELKDKGVVVMLLHPGYVRSGMTKGMDMPNESVYPEEAAEKLWRNVVSQKTIEDTGRFWHREGFELQW